jgi:hypothetical protein
MFRLLSLLTAVAVGTASVANCGSSWYVKQFAVDPPAAVGAGQNVSMTATFEVPAGSPIKDGLITAHGSLSYLAVMEFSYSMCDYLPCPLTEGNYTWSWVSAFPEEAFGRIQTTLTLKGLAATKPWVCLRWTAYATGSASNATNAAIKWLYS